MTRIQMNFERYDLPKGLHTAQTRIGYTKQEKPDGTILHIQGVIGEEFAGGTAPQLVKEIGTIQTPIILRINSPGGFVHDALDIYDALINHPYNVRADIVSEAWSAATIITSAADEIRISPAARYGVHRAWNGLVVVGNSEELRSQVTQIEAYATYLDKLDWQIADIVSKKARQDVTQQRVYEWMIGPEGQDGTQWVGQEAVDIGVVDSLIPTGRNDQEAEPQCEDRDRQAIMITGQRRANKIARIRAGLTQ